VQKFVALAFLASSCAAAGAAPISFTCSFPVQATPEGVTKPEKPLELRFVWDESAKRSYLMGNNGAAEVELIENTNGLSFVEITASGNVMVTAITEAGQAVHSRNSIFRTALVPSQYYGKCIRQ
jgi:hypothetical protein